MVFSPNVQNLFVHLQGLNSQNIASQTSTRNNGVRSQQRSTGQSRTAFQDSNPSQRLGNLIESQSRHNFRGAHAPQEQDSRAIPEHVTPPTVTLRDLGVGQRSELNGRVISGEADLSSNMVPNLRSDETQETSQSQRTTLTMDQAQDLLRHLGEDDRVPYQMVEYDCIFRCDVAIASAIEDGISPEALGRVSSLAPDLSNQRVNSYTERVAEGANQADTATGTFTREDPFLQSVQPMLERYRPEDPGVVNHVRYGETDLSFYHDGSVQVGDDPLRYHPGNRVMWSVGHIAMTAEVQTDQGVQTMVLDPAISPDRPITMGEWQAAQNYPEGTIVHSGLGETPVLQPQYLSENQLGRAATILQAQGHTPEGSLSDRSSQESFVNQCLEEMNEEQQGQFYNRFYNIDEGSLWEYDNWAGFSIVGPPAGTDGTDYNQLDPEDPEFQQREQVSVNALERGRVFQSFVRELQSGQTFHFTPRPISQEEAVAQ